MHTTKIKRKLLTTILLIHLHQLFTDLARQKFGLDQDPYPTEGYEMDNKILKAMMDEIVMSGEYTLEGIAYHTRIPFDIVYEAAAGISRKISFTTCIKLMTLYIQINPDISQILRKHLFELIKNDTQNTILHLLEEFTSQTK